MLAYVFWHWPSDDVTDSFYRDALLAFHDGLAANLPSGMRGSVVWRVRGASWLPGGSGYEEWYLLEDTAALGTIGPAATSGVVGPLHDAIAGLAGDGTAGLYQPAAESVGDLNGSTALWFRKPKGMTYEELYAGLGDDTRRLWKRMLVLGPTPEFCMLADEPHDLSSGFQAMSVKREQISPGIG